MPSLCTISKWKWALREVHDGVEFTQQRAAYQQLAKYGAPHWGRGGKDSWKDIYVSALYLVI